MSIAQAKRELFNQLRSERAVTGAGIKEKNGAEYIVIFITRPKSVLSIKIPSTYKGNKVVTELTSPARAV
jgi:hypothetical protein